MIKVYGVPIYDTEDEVVNQLSADPYYRSFPIKVKITKGDYDELRWFRWWAQWDYLLSFGKQEFEFDEGSTYIMTVYNQHHQQLLNPSIVSVNFNCTEKKLICPLFRHQLYSGPAGGTYCYDIIFDENGHVLQELDKDGSVLADYEYDETGFTVTKRKYMAGDKWRTNYR